MSYTCMMLRHVAAAFPHEIKGTELTTPGSMLSSGILGEDGSRLPAPGHNRYVPSRAHSLVERYRVENRRFDIDGPGNLKSSPPKYSRPS